jgi:hypothetical protein
MVLDLDVTDDETHGEAEGAVFNGYYQSTCDTPLYLYFTRIEKVAIENAACYQLAVILPGACLTEGLQNP